MLVPDNHPRGIGRTNFNRFANEYAVDSETANECSRAHSTESLF